MSNVVFVLGAGASKQCGAPLMADFLDVASRLHSIGNVAGNEVYFENVFKAIGALQAVYSKSQLDLNNIESVFNAFEVANTLGKLPGFQAEEIPGIIESLKQVIVTTLENTIEFPTRDRNIFTPPPYGHFADLLKYIRDEAFPTRTVSVITFNYDIAIDMALYNARIRIDYSIDSSDTPQSIPVLKLHGSLNWASKADDGSVIPLTLDNYLSKYRTMGWEKTGKCFIPIGTQLQEYFSKHADIKVKAEPVIVPPSWNKAEHHQMLSQVWGRAAKELGEAEFIFIIGYSLTETDAFFRLLYAIGTVGENPLKKIEVFNPDGSEKIHARFESILGPGAMARFRYLTLNFADSIQVIKTYFPSRQ